MSPLVALVLKKNLGELRFCCDYRKLNTITVRNQYPLLLILEFMERLRWAWLFVKLDFQGAYNLVRILKGDKWKTAFRTQYRHFEYMVMPFRLTNPSAVFMYLMHNVFRDLLDTFVVIYMDDILMYSSAKEHWSHI